MGIALWAVQILLAGMFGMAGFMKSTVPIVELSKTMAWAADVPMWLVRFIGISELSAAFGLILPAATRIKPVLTPLAASGLIVIMILASAFHLSRGEAQFVPMNLILGLLAAFVAWGRFAKAPITGR